MNYSIKRDDDFSIPTWQLLHCKRVFFAIFTSGLYSCLSFHCSQPLILPHSSVALIRRLTSLVCLHSTGTASETQLHLQAKSELVLISDNYFKVIARKIFIIKLSRKWISSVSPGCATLATLNAYCMRTISRAYVPRNVCFNWLHQLHTHGVGLCESQARRWAFAFGKNRNSLSCFLYIVV